MPQASLAAWLKPKDSSTKLKRESRTINSVTEKSKSPQATIVIDDETAAQNNHDTDDGQNAPVASMSGPVITLQIPSNAQLVPITASLLTDFRRLVALLLPVPYRDRFFVEILDDPVTAAISCTALWRDEPASTAKLVAGIRCRLFEKPVVSIDDPELCDKPCLYIAVIGTLAPFRNYGLASALLAQVTLVAAQQYGCKTAMAHVWEDNEEARVWYAKLGFQESFFEPAYYSRMKPAGAYVVMRKIQPSDLLRRVCSASDKT